MSYSEINIAESNLERIALKYPGNALELRVPGAGVVNILKGVNHRRGTPANVVEIELEYFNKLCKGEVSFTKGIEEGYVRASGVLSKIDYIFDNTPTHGN